MLNVMPQAMNNFPERSLENKIISSIKQNVQINDNPPEVKS
jgi:hypothetical protein